MKLLFLAAVLCAERLWPLRPRREPSARHVGRDAAMAAMSVVATGVLQSLLLPRQQRTKAVPRAVLDFLLLDYTLWQWHWLNHHVPLLWRFHRVHHADLDLDAATGARFHFGEMSLSVLFRWLQLVAIRPDARALSVWQTTLLASIAFHHSNTRLPEEVDRVVARVIVTPRLHGIHHSIVERETNSNYASLLTVWDFLHGAFRDDVPQEAITIGVRELQRPEDVTLPRLITMPFEADRGDDRPA